MDCPYCLSVWIATPFAFSLARTIPSWIAVWLAISGRSFDSGKGARAIIGTYDF